MATKTTNRAMKARRRQARKDKKQRQDARTMEQLPREWVIINAADSALDIKPPEINDGEESGNRKFTMRAYNGGLMRLRGYPFPVVVDLKGVKVERQKRPIFREHDPNRVVGHSTSIEVGARYIDVAGEISGTGDAANEFVATASKGFPWQSSIGARPEEMVFLDRREKQTVNGRSITGPAYIARRTRLREISVVALGADDTTNTRIEAGHYKGFEMDFKEWLQANGWDYEALSAEQRVHLEAAYNADIEAAGDDEDDDAPPANPPSKKKTPAPIRASDSGDDQNPDDDSDIISADRERRAAEMERQEAIIDKCGEYRDIAAQAIREGWGVDRAELELLRQRRPQSPGTSSGGASFLEASETLEAAMLMASGMPEDYVGEQYGEKTMNAALGRQYRGLGLHALMYESIRAAGMHYQAGKVDDDFIRTAFEADRKLNASSGFSSVGLTGILSNVANKQLLRAYKSVDVKWPEICAVADHKDFKATTKYRMTGVGSYQSLTPTGELKHISLSEESYQNQLATKGAMLTIPREDLINDDLGSFNQATTVLGRFGNIAVEKSVFELLLSNPSNFFQLASDPINYMEGAATPLDIDSLTDAERLFMDLKDSNGDPIMVNPAILLVPTNLSVTAAQLFNDTKVEITTTANKAKPASNPHAGKFKPVTARWLNNVNLTGYSTTAWYLFANPADLAAMEVAFLRGRRVPVIESGQTSFNTLGMSWRSFLDWGAAMRDPRGAVKSKGAA